MMHVELDRPLPPESVLTLDIGWHYQVPVQGGRTGRQEFPEGWLYQIAQLYPRLAVYDDVRGWNTDQYFGSSEFYLEYGDFDVTLTAPSGYTLAGTGTLTNGAQVFPPLIQRRLAAAAHADTIVHIITASELGTPALLPAGAGKTDRKSTRLNSSHPSISYAVFCLKKKNSCSSAGPDIPPAFSARLATPCECPVIRAAFSLSRFCMASRAASSASPLPQRV